MLVGEDFEKISFDLFGYTLLEPNAFIGDLIIFIVSLYCANRIAKLNQKGPFYTYWYWFNIVFGVGFLIGGFSHLFFLSWGVNGKYIPWCMGIFSAFLLEMAMISVFPQKKTKKRYSTLSVFKLVLVLITALYTFISVDLSVDTTKGLMIPTVNSVVGLGFSLIVLGKYYSNKLDRGFRYFWISGLLLFPSAVFQTLKINLYPLFDRNDVSHLLLLISLVLFYKGIKAFALQQKPLTADL